VAVCGVPISLWKHQLTNLVTDRGEVLTRHFAQNWGAPYKFGVSVQSKGFEDAPDSILRALQRMRWAGKQAVAETVAAMKGASVIDCPNVADTFVDFNELLSLGYMQQDKIDVGGTALGNKRSLALLTCL